jgi:hypothetical protein
MPAYMMISEEDLTEIGRSDISAGDIMAIQNKVRSSPVPTCDLVDELSKREGVTEYSCPTPDDGWCLYASPKGSAGTHPFTGEGPARILVVID